jgi:hypothetical protein
MSAAMRKSAHYGHDPAIEQPQQLSLVRRASIGKSRHSDSGGARQRAGALLLEACAYESESIRPLGCGLTLRLDRGGRHHLRPRQSSRSRSVFGGLNLIASRAGSAGGAGVRRRALGRRVSAAALRFI